MSSSQGQKTTDIYRQMKAVPLAPSPHPDYVASLLAEEAHRRKQAFNTIGIAAYTTPLPSTTPKEVNKTFLANTILGVDSHNRREQIDDCWRAHRLNTKIEETVSASDRKRKRRTMTTVESSSRGLGGSNRRSESSHRIQCLEGRDVAVNDDDERSYWARLKAKKLNTQHLNQDDGMPLSQGELVTPSSVLLAAPSITSAEKSGNDKKEKKKKHKHKNKKDKDKDRDQRGSEKKHKKEKKKKKKEEIRWKRKHSSHSSRHHETDDLTSDSDSSVSARASNI